MDKRHQWTKREEPTHRTLGKERSQKSIPINNPVQHLGASRAEIDWLGGIIQTSS
jgi:hypothetical protein